MVRIEAEAIAPAAPPAVWQVLIDHERWPEWHASIDGAVRLSRVELLSGQPDRVGTIRHCTATFSSLPLLGRREVSWTEWITDVRRPWTLEYEAGGRRLIKRWRVRLILVEQPDGRTRVRCRVWYTPRSLASWIANCLILRRAIGAWMAGALANLVLACAPPGNGQPDAAGADASPAVRAQPAGEPLPAMEARPTAESPHTAVPA